MDAQDRFRDGESVLWLPRIVFETGKVFCGCPGSFSWDKGNGVWMPSVVFGTGRMMYDCPMFF